MILTGLKQMLTGGASSQNHGFLTGLFAFDIQRFGHIYFDYNMFHVCLLVCDNSDEVFRLDNELSGEQNFGCKIAGVVQGLT